MADGLRDRLIGAWTFASHQGIPVDGSDPFEPLGHEPRGIIMYTPDGYMSAQLSKPDRPNFASGDWFASTAEDYQQEATSYIAYCGPSTSTRPTKPSSTRYSCRCSPTGPVKPSHAW